MLRATARQISFADWELMRQGDRGVRGWSRCWKRSPLFSTTSGTYRVYPARSGAGPEAARWWRHGLTATQVLRSLVLMRLKNWDLASYARRIADGLTLRRFAGRLLLRAGPETRCLPAWLRHPSDATDAESSQRLGGSGGGRLGLEDGAKAGRALRWCRPTFIIRPTTRCYGMWSASSHAWSAVWPKRWKYGQIKGFCDRTRSARRRMYEIQRMTTRQRHQQQTHTYRVLIDIAEEVVGNARAGLEGRARCAARTCLPDLAIEELRGQIERFCRGLGDRAVDRHVVACSSASRSLRTRRSYSIFEPHTDLIKRGKVRTPVEFGHKVFLAESAEGLITQYEVLKGNPPDEVHVASSLRRHRQAFRRAPELYGSDRGFFSEQNLASCKHAGVKLGALREAGRRNTATPSVREARHSRTVSAFAPASRDASRCCSEAAA